jgi:hypothetical protein
MEIVGIVAAVARRRTIEANEDNGVSFLVACPLGLGEL